MDEKANEIVVDLLQAIAESNERLIDISLELGKKKEISDITRGMDLRNYESGSVIEIYIEANLKINKIVCWFVECSFAQDRWVIDYQVFLVDDYGHHILQQCPELHATNVIDFICNFKKTVSFVEDSLHNFNFASLEN